jgi:CDP-glycerol glycerophosphotransferase (TagB/SpsB family)
MYRLFGLDYYDSILFSGESEINEIRSLENIRRLPSKQIAVVGNTYFDICVEKIKQIPQEENHPFTVLVSPSWGPSSLFKVYGEKLLNPLSETGWRIIVRPHPQSLIVEKPMINELIGRYKNNSNIEWDYNRENIYAMAKADVMISDFSGIICDFVFLFDKPVLLSLRSLDLRLYDAHCLKEEPLYLQTLKKIGLELDESKLDAIKETISGLSQNEELKENRQKAKKVMWQYQGESGKRIVDYMIKTASEEGIIA